MQRHGPQALALVHVVEILDLHGLGPHMAPLSRVKLAGALAV